MPCLLSPAAVSCVRPPGQPRCYVTYTHKYLHCARHHSRAPCPAPDLSQHHTDYDYLDIRIDYSQHSEGKTIKRALTLFVDICICMFISYK